MKSFLLGVVFALCAFLANPVNALADSGSNSGPGSGYDGGGAAPEIVCKIEAKGKGFIVVAESGKCFHFDFKVESKYDKLEGHFKAFDEESGIWITSTKVLNVASIDDQTVSVDLEVSFGTEQPGTINIVVRDSGKSWECDSFQITLDDGASISGTVGHGCKCDWGFIKVEIKCEEKCKGGRFCKGHPFCKEHPFCKGKKCKGHKDCGGRDDDDDDDGHSSDDDDDGHSGDDDDDGHSGRDDDDDGAGRDHDDDDGDGKGGGHKCKGHSECKPVCKGGTSCKGHPKCEQHSTCEVPNCKGHKACKDAVCNGHPECRKNYKHKKGCKAKVSAKYRCSCKALGGRK